VCLRHGVETCDWVDEDSLALTLTLPLGRTPGSWPFNSHSADLAEATDPGRPDVRTRQDAISTEGKPSRPPHARPRSSSVTMKCRRKLLIQWSRRSGLNRGPADYEEVPCGYLRVSLGSLEARLAEANYLTSRVLVSISVCLS
jgi:hypothetical protein